MATIEEMKRGNIDKMGEALGTQFSALWHEVASLHEKWEQFLELYGTRPERIDLFNQTAPHFFARLQNILWEDIVLHIARITDPPNSQGRKDRLNLTICNFPNLSGSKKIANELEAKIGQATQATAFARDWRNRHIAHRDLAAAIDENSKPIERASRKNVSDALRAVDDVMNLIEGEYLDSETGYEGMAIIGGAVELLRTLHDGRQVAAQRNERIKSGNILEEDFPPDL